MNKIGKYILAIVIVGILIGVLFFIFKKDGYHVTFNSNGGSIVESSQTGFKGIVKKPDDPVREGYLFLGWYLEEGKFNFATKIDEDITLTALWEKIEDQEYTVLFDSLSDEDLKIQVKEGETIKEVPIPEREGYQFLYWCYHNKKFDFSNPINRNMVLVAKYQKDNHKKEMVKVSFDSNGGSKIDDQEVEVGKKAVKPDDPVREGYLFLGWYLDQEEFSFLEEIDEDITLVALWLEE